MFTPNRRLEGVTSNTLMTLPPRTQLGLALRPVLACLFALVLFAPSAWAAEDGKFAFDLPAGKAVETLRMAAQQAGIEIMFPEELVRDTRTPAVAGRHSPLEVLTLMLADTALKVLRDEKTGAFAITRNSDPNGPGAPPMSERPTAANVASPDDVITLEAFRTTGSLLPGASTFTSPTPVLVVERVQLLLATPASIVDGIKQLPAVTPGGGQTVGGGTGNNSANFLNLRGLGQTRTLTLLDGNRFTPGGPTGQVDSNLIPQELLSHVDIVTGGASAAYGSDAVGGVINYVLNKEFTGLRTSVHFGVAERGDNQEYKASFAYGTPYLDGRGHFMFSAEYLKSEGVNGDGRRFRRELPSMMPDPANTGSLIRVADVRTPFTPGGLIITGAGGSAANNAAFRGIMFGENGVRQSYNYGSPTNTVGRNSGFQSGGDGLRVGTTQEIVRPLERQNLFARTDFKLTENFTLYFQGAVSATDMTVQNSPTNHTLTIKRTNPFLNQAAPELVAQMTALGVTSLTMNRTTLENGLTETQVTTENLFGLLGFNATIGDWRWHTSFQRGTNDLDIPVNNNLIRSRMTLATDAVLSGGSILCASASINPDCVPFNPFGIGAPSQAALDYVMGRSEFNNYTSQQVADTSFSGELFSLPAGPVTIALGAHWRKLESQTTVDALSIAGGYRLANNKPFYGAYEISEQFVETEVPLLENAGLAKALTLNLSARRTDYSTTGTENAWKTGLVWRLNDQFRVRVSHSRDIRAPNLDELFLAGVQTNGVVNDSLTGKTYIAVPNIRSGNIDLQPETAFSTILGFTYQPAGIPGLSLAVDTYIIEIEDAIFFTGGVTAVQQCNLDPTSPLCAFVSRGPNLADPNAVIQTRTSPVNLNRQTMQGTDFEISYKVPMDRFFTSFDAGGLRVRAIASYVDENVLVGPLAPGRNQAGNSIRNSTAGTEAMPRVRGLLSLNHTRGPIASFLQLRYIGGMTWDKTRTLGVNTDFNDVASAAYFDGQVSYRTKLMGREVEVFLSVQNLLDKDPVFSPRTGGATPLPTEPGLFDQIGRMYRLGLRTAF